MHVYAGLVTALGASIGPGSLEHAGPDSGSGSV